MFCMFVYLFVCMFVCLSVFNNNCPTFPRADWFRAMVNETIDQDPVPQKPISANRGLNLTNRRLKFIPWLYSVPESPICADQGINEGLNFIHLPRSINSPIGEKS